MKIMNKRKGIEVFTTDDESIDNSNDDNWFRTI